MVFKANDEPDAVEMKPVEIPVSVSDVVTFSLMHEKHTETFSVYCFRLLKIADFHLMRKIRIKRRTKMQKVNLVLEPWLRQKIYF